MAKGDIFRLALSGKGIAQDASWVPGALASEFPVDIVSVTRPIGPDMQATVRARSDAPLSMKGRTLRPSGAIAAPGVSLPEATITQADLIGRSPEARASAPATWLTDEVKWLGAVALIVTTAFLSSRIKK